VADGRHSEQFWAGARDAHRQVQLGLLLRNGIHGVDLGQMGVAVLERDPETEGLAAN
jgi:hypothetical protein